MPSFPLSELAGADITDYFNYGFTEETWRLYCEKQRKTRGEVAQLNKIAVSNYPWDFSKGIPSWYSSVRASCIYTYYDCVACSRLLLCSVVELELGVVLLHTCSIMICMLLMILIFISELLIIHCNKKISKFNTTQDAVPPGTCMLYTNTMPPNFQEKKNKDEEDPS